MPIAVIVRFKVSSCLFRDSLQCLSFNHYPFFFFRSKDSINVGNGVSCLFSYKTGEKN